MCTCVEADVLVYVLLNIMDSGSLAFKREINTKPLGSFKCPADPTDIC